MAGTILGALPSKNIPPTHCRIISQSRYQRQILCSVCKSLSSGRDIIPLGFQDALEIPRRSGQVGCVKTKKARQELLLA